MNITKTLYGLVATSVITGSAVACPPPPPELPDGGLKGGGCAVAVRMPDEGSGSYPPDIVFVA